MRGLILALLLANVAFFGWAHWIDVPQAAHAAAPASALPLLALASTASNATAAAPLQPGQSGPAATGVAAQATPSGTQQGANGERARCRSLGPFATAAAAHTVADVLHARKLAPRSRTVDITLAGGTVSAYWLDVDLAAGEPDPPLAALRDRVAGGAAALRGVAFSDCPAAGPGG